VTVATRIKVTSPTTIKITAAGTRIKWIATKAGLSNWPADLSGAGILAAGIRCLKAFCDLLSGISGYLQGLLR